MPHQTPGLHHCGLCLVAKYVMKTWGWHQSDLWADPEAGTLKLAGETIMTAAVQHGALCVEYAEGWNDYFNTDAYPEMKQLVSNSGSKIKKGAGKGGDKAGAKSRKGL